MRAPRFGLVVAVLLVLGALPATADALASKVDAARGGSLPIDGTVDNAAQASAQRQANAGSLSHASLSGLPCSAAGEVIGYGPNIDAIWLGFKNSSPHWSIITKGGWTAMGTGIATASDGAVFVSIIFCTGSSAPPPAAPPPQAPPSSAPSASSTPPAKAPAAAGADAEERSAATGPKSFAEFISGWLDAMAESAVSDFGAMPPPIAADGDLLAVMPIVV